MAKIVKTVTKTTTTTFKIPSKKVQKAMAKNVDKLIPKNF